MPKTYYYKGKTIEIADWMSECAPCEDYCCSPFISFHDDQFGTVPELHNDIHRIFRRNRFSTDVNYADLEQSLRLASRFLEAPSVLGYVNTIVYGEVRDREGHEVDICSLDDDEFLERQPATWPDTEIYILPSREHNNPIVLSCRGCQKVLGSSTERCRPLSWKCRFLSVT